MDTPNDSAFPLRRRRRRVFLLGMALFLTLLPAGVYSYLRFSANRALSAAIAEADELDPRWRLDELEADRVPVPDERNSALIVQAAARLLPEKWPAWEIALKDQGDPMEAKRWALDMSFSDLESQQQINTEQIDALSTEMNRAAAAVNEARKLADLPDGRYPVTYSDDYISTGRPHVQGVRDSTKLLALDAMLQAQDAQSDGAITSCRAALNSSRSLGDEPFLTSLLARISCRSIAVFRTERVLAQGGPSDPALSQLQQLLEREEAEPVLLTALRGERAGLDQRMESVQAGKLRLTHQDLGLDGLTGQGVPEPTLGDHLALEWSPGFVRYQRAAMLRYLTRAVEIAKLPPDQQEEAFRQLEATANDQPILVRKDIVAWTMVVNTCLRTKAQLRCAVAIVATERYRQARGQWPDTVGELKDAGYLKDSLIDLYDGKPLRLRRVHDGLIVYSIGPDCKDDGGNLYRRQLARDGTDEGFRLWDVASRRQPPAPPKPPEPGDGF